MRRYLRGDNDAKVFAVFENGRCALAFQRTADRKQGAVRSRIYLLCRYLGEKCARSRQVESEFLSHIREAWGLREKLETYRKSIDLLGISGTIARSRVRHIGTSSVHPRCSDHKLVVRSETSDLMVFDQIFLEKEYRCIDKLREIRTIVDAGANVGYSSAYLLSRFQESRVVAIEPDPENFAVLKENLAPWGSRATLLNGALWSEPTTLNFRKETMLQGEEWGRQVESSASGEVRAFDMPHIMAAYDMDEIDLLKIDIEGAEEAVFSAPDISWLGRVKNIVIELHGQRCASIFLEAVESQGYEISRCDELTVCLHSGR